METWKPVVGFEGKYEVSDRGGVRSFVNCAGGRPLKPGRSSNGYLTVALNRRSYPVQWLVAGAFIGPRPEGMLVLHADGVRSNNCLDNLRYGSAVDNRRDADAHQTSVRGEQYCSAKLTDAAAREIRRLKGFVSQASLAKRYRVSPSAVQAVHDGRTWTHV